MVKSKTTKKYGRLALIFTLLSMACLLGPLAFYVGVGLATATLITQKVAIVASVALALTISLVCVIRKWVFRSKIWLIILALYFVINNFIVMILVFAITQTADELIFSPLARHFRNKKSINYEIDKRLTDK